MRSFIFVFAFALLSILSFPLALFAQDVLPAALGASSVTDICTNFAALPSWLQAFLGATLASNFASFLTNFKWAQPNTPLGRIVNILGLYFRKS